MGAVGGRKLKPVRKWHRASRCNLISERNVRIPVELAAVVTKCFRMFNVLPFLSNLLLAYSCSDASYNAADLLCCQPSRDSPNSGDPPN